jgi:hypothetical protein
MLVGRIGFNLMIKNYAYFVLIVRAEILLSFGIEIFAKRHDIQYLISFTANGPAIKLVGVAERMEVVITNLSSG